jgi:hypothetical protein
MYQSFYVSFGEARKYLHRDLYYAPAVKTERWQGVAANTDTRELANVDFRVPLHGKEDLDHWRADIKPNLPWADDHFLERVGGEPLNPGVQWAKWPWANRADRFREGGRFNHTYMERLWPKFTRRSEDGRLPNKVGIRKYPATDTRPKLGVVGYYGDLGDLVIFLSGEPHTRQAYIPLFFPEDTGIGDGGRKVCTLGYHFMVRDDRLSIWYPMRSCDFVRHWADDCYLAVRLLLWVLDRCREIRPDFWGKVVPGDYAMHVSSLHVFESDHTKMGETQ